MNHPAPDAVTALREPGTRPGRRPADVASTDLRRAAHGYHPRHQGHRP